ncbi:hypothetical protein ACMGD3_19795 [Lysinibacillus sphaericus]|uniref:hypothetical protein n=1 Tax=Lysinibacillus sphaericus TaxID=1421 RepID=UPI003F78F53C
MNSNFIISDYIKFEARPEAIPYYYRLSYRISLTVLIFKLTGGRGGCSLSKIHLITTSMYSEEEMDHLIKYLEPNQQLLLNLRYDPTVNSTIEFMIADQLIFQQKNGYYRLTKKGATFANKIIANKDLLKYEKEQLNKIGTNLSESVMDRIHNTLMG